MSDPTWASRTILKGSAGTLYVQAAGATAAPGTAAEVAFVSEFSLEAAQQNSRSPSFLNYSGRKVIDGGTEVSGEFTAVMAAGADDNFETLMNAVSDRTRLKLTLILDDGPTYAIDNVLMGFSVEGSGDDGFSTGFSYEADSYEYTAAT